MIGVIVKTQFEALHCYPDAPMEVAYIRTPHRHVFHVEAEVETFHEDREIEFIMLKQDLNTHIYMKYGSGDIGSTSCEMIALALSGWIKKRYPVPEKREISNFLAYADTRKVNIKVFEDNENGAFVREF
jgi:hypothetical protein